MTQLKEHPQFLAEESPTTSAGAPPLLESSYLDFAIILAKRKYFILSLTAGTAIIALVVSLLLPNVYTGNAKILPPQQSQSTAMSMLGQLSPLVNVAAGKDLGLRNQNELYVAMLRSRTVEDSLVDRYALMNRYGTKLREDARRRLRSNSEIVAGKDGVISISVEDRDPQSAAELANGYIAELEKLTQTLAVTDAGKQRLFFEREVKAANDELAQAEVALKETEERTGIIHLDSQSKVMMESLARLRAQVAAKTVQVQAMRSYATPENPDLIFAEQELAALRGQVLRGEQGGGKNSKSEIGLDKVPEAGLDYVRRLREVKYRETLLELLTKQYEVARIDEAKEAAVIQVLDPAIAPERRSRPQRAALVSLFTLLGLIVGILFSLMTEVYEKHRHDPVHAFKLQLLRKYL